MNSSNVDHISRSALTNFSQTKPKLADMPDNVLEHILRFVAHEHTNRRFEVTDLPFDILPASQTCKRLRFAASGLISNLSWKEELDRRYAQRFRQIQECTFSISITNRSERQEFNIPPQDEASHTCKCSMCVINRWNLGWYSLALHKLRRISISEVFLTLFSTEANKLIQTIRQDCKTIEELDLTCCDLDIALRPSILHAIRLILLPSSENIQHLLLSDTTSSFCRKIYDNVMIYPLPRLKNLFISFCNPRNYISPIWASRDLFNHLRETGTCLEKLIIDVGIYQAALIGEIAGSCPPIDHLVINIKYDTDVKFADKLSLFKVRALTISRARFTKRDTPKFVKYVSEDPYLQELHLKKCRVLYPKKMIKRTNYYFTNLPDIRYRLKTLHIIQKIDVSSMEAISRGCYGLQSLNISCSCNYENLKAMGQILQNLKALRNVALHVTKPGDIIFSDLMEGFLRCSSSLECIITKQVIFTKSEIDNILTRFRKSIRKFCLHGIPKRARIYVSDMLDIFKNLKELRPDHFIHIREIDFPWTISSPKDADESKKIAKSIIDIIRVMEAQYEHFDGANLLERLEYLVNHWVEDTNYDCYNTVWNLPQGGNFHNYM